ncbi:MAG: metal-dependent hydrolase [Gammaproteobacteria bacterium]|nr:metal-dependent hydrolase [Gammaproteobacteria bacterium]
MSETQHHHPLVARNVKFQWESTPQPWLPGDSFTSHFINVLHLLLPEGELWFCRLYNQALPEIEDETLHSDVKGFIRQEAIHSRSHQVVLDRYFSDNGIVTEPYTRRVRWLFTDLLGENPFGITTEKQWVKRAWLTFRLGLIAAIEHFTCVIGRWILECRGLDEAGADPVMMDLLRWHGAEEVEHRTVAHDLFEQRGGGYLYRVMLMLLVGPMLLLLWFLGTRFFLRQDPAATQNLKFIREWRRAARQDRLPTMAFLWLSVWRYLRPGYHPRDEAETGQALDYLQRSPAAVAAAAR